MVLPPSLSEKRLGKREETAEADAYATTLHEAVEILTEAAKGKIFGTLTAKAGLRRRRKARRRLRLRLEPRYESSRTLPCVCAYVTTELRAEPRELSDGERNGVQK